MQQKTKQLKLLPRQQKPRLEALLEAREAILRQFADAVRRDDKRRCRRCLSRLRHTSELIQLYGRLAAQEPGSSRAAHSAAYMVSSLFLYECFRELTADKKEQFFFVTGPEVSGTKVLDQRVVFAHKERTMGGVTGDQRDTLRVLMLLESFRHRLLAHFHSHPCLGPQGTTPSGKDKDFQSRLEQAGHIAVAAIFSRDGWVRFFRVKDRVDISVYGEGVEKREANLFRLTHVPAGRR